MTAPVRWTPDDDAKLKAVVGNDGDMTMDRWIAVASQFEGRTRYAVRQRFYDLRRKANGIVRVHRLRPERNKGVQQVQRLPNEAEVLAIVAQLPKPKTITALVFGDPLPGRSALDRMLAGADA